MTDSAARRTREGGTRIRPWMVLFMGVVVWVTAQTWDLQWHGANPGVPGHDVAHAMFTVGIALGAAGVIWQVAAGIRTSH